MKYVIQVYGGHLKEARYVNRIGLLVAGVNSAFIYTLEEAVKDLELNAVDNLKVKFKVKAVTLDEGTHITLKER